MMNRYLQSDYVGTLTLSKVEKCVNAFQQYIACFPSVLKLSVSLIGSYSSGLASRSGSMVDLLVRMDGGSLTMSLNSDELASALSAGLKDWAFLTSVTPLLNNSGTLICETEESCIFFRIRACNTEKFPVSHLFHSKLFASYLNIDPSKIVVFLNSIKHWSRISGFSSPVPYSACPLSGFHWTIIGLFFLQACGFIPSVFQGSVAFGPKIEDSFASMPQHFPIKVPIGELVGRFFSWLAKTDLLSTIVSLKQEKHIQGKKGWLNILDPTLPYEQNTVDPSFDQKEQVLFAMKLSREAGKLTHIKTEQELVGIVYAKSISMLTSGNGPVCKISVAV